MRLEFGNSLENGRPVSEELTARFPVTFGIATAAVAVALLVGVPAGVLGGLRPGSALDRLGVLAASTGIAIPSFWMAMLLVADDMVILIGSGGLFCLLFAALITHLRVKNGMVQMLPAMALATLSLAIFLQTF